MSFMTRQRLTPRRHRTRVVAAGACGTLALVSLTGCQSAANSAAGTSVPHRGGALTIVQSADIEPSTFMAQNNPNFSIMRAVFNTLIDDNHKTLKPQPELATSWKLAPNDKTITFKLRHGVTFQTGRPFTAADVVFSIKAMRREDVPSQLKPVAAAITTMQTRGDYEVTLHLAHPVANLFDLFELMPIVDKDSFNQLLTGKKMIGTGPFKVVSYTPGSQVVLKRYDRYWVKGRPYLNEIKIEVESQAQSMLSSLKSGQSQLALDLSPQDLVSLKNNSNFRVIASNADDAVYYVASNVNVAPLNNEKVRQGIAWAIDRKRVLDEALGGIGQTSSLPWSPASPAFNKSQADTYTQNLEKAKQLIDQAGAAGAKVNVVYNAGLPSNEAIAEIVQFNLKQVGLNPNLVPLQAADFLSKLSDGKLPGLFVNVHGFGQLNPSTLVTGAFPFNADANSSNFDSAQYKRLANQVWTTTGGARAKKVYGKLNDFLLREQFVNDLVVSSHTFTISRNLKGLSYTMYDSLDYDDAYLR